MKTQQQIKTIMRIYKRNKMDLDSLYKKHEGYLKKESLRYAKMFQVEFEEIFGSACEIFCEFAPDWNPQKGKFTTFIHHQLKRLRNTYEKKAPFENSQISLEEFGELIHNLYQYQPQFQFEFYDSLEKDLSPAARGLILKLINGEINRDWKGKRKMRACTLERNFGVADWVLREIRVWWKSYSKNYVFC